MRSDNACIHESMAAAIRLDEPIACSLRPAIDAENSHENQSGPGCPAREGIALGERFDFRFVYFIVGIDVLHIVVLFKNFVELQHRLRVLSFQFDRVLGNHRDLG
jgi:hypothetical protein